jgi:hypothetical protein
MHGDVGGGGGGGRGRRGRGRGRGERRGGRLLVSRREGEEFLAVDAKVDHPKDAEQRANAEKRKNGEEEWCAQRRIEVERENDAFGKRTCMVG